MINLHKDEMNYENKVNKAPRNLVVEVILSMSKGNFHYQDARKHTSTGSACFRARRSQSSIFRLLISWCPDCLIPIRPFHLLRLQVAIDRLAERREEEIGAELDE